MIDALKELNKLEVETGFEENISEIQTIIKGIFVGSSRVTQIVASLRDFSRLDEAPLKTVDIHKGLNASLLLLSSQLSNKNIRIHKKYTRDLPQVKCYVSQLNQVFIIILTNAIQAINQKGKITISTQMINEKIEISFKDTGSGIPKEVIDKIFDPFFTTKDIGEGKGLGLSAVYGIIQKHKGSIKVNSEIGKGTEFIINFAQSI